MAWPEPVERVAAVLRAAAVDARIEEFSDGTPTAREAAAAVGCELAQIVKSLVLVCDGGFVLALVPGDRRADESAVGAAVSAQHVRVARADEVVHATGFEPGGGRAVSAARRHADAHGPIVLRARASSGSGRGRRPTWRRSSPPSCFDSRARGPSTSSAAGRIRTSKGRGKGARRCRRPRRSG